MDRSPDPGARNYEVGMVATFHRAANGFKAGDFAEVTRIVDRSIFAQTEAGERQLPLRSSAYSIARPRELEVAAGDRLLIRANDRSAGFLNGEIITVQEIESGRIWATEGRLIDRRRFREFEHGFAVTSHAAQSKTVEHIVVAAARLNAKAAYVACSRGQVSCVVHTPDKTALLDQLPDGNREAALDLLQSEHSLAKHVLDRSRPWWASTS